MTDRLPAPVAHAPRAAWRDGAVTEGVRAVAEETPVALTYNRATYAVMMATPADLEDFAVGFSLTERIVESAADIRELDVVAVPDGVELRMWLDADRLDAVQRRMRRIAGATGCGLCGIESLAEAARPPLPVTCDLRVTPEAIQEAMAALTPLQALGEATRAVHAAAFWQPGRGIVAVREDVGRHNALDKLAGAVARGGMAACAGAVLLTSRVSVELVQKVAAMGAGVLVAVSAPTALALRTADAAGITLVAVARRDGFEVFTHPGRVAVHAAV